MVLDGGGEDCESLQQGGSDASDREMRDRKMGPALGNGEFWRQYQLDCAGIPYLGRSMTPVDDLYCSIRRRAVSIKLISRSHKKLTMPSRVLHFNNA